MYECMREKWTPAGCFILFRVVGLSFLLLSDFVNYDNQQWLILIILDLVHRNMGNQSFELKKKSSDFTLSIRDLKLPPLNDNVKGQ